MNKQRWVEIMKAAGISEAQMLKWHQTFERLEPAEHQKFLASLKLPMADIARIRSL